MNNDLISRNALREALSQMPYNDYDDLTRTENLIDNAPTIEVPENAVNCVLTMFGKCSYNETGCSDCEIKDKIRKALSEEPQGEWIAREDMDYLDENKVVHNHFECNKCGLVHDFIDGHTSQYNFCPQCGADMRGEKK